MGAAARYTARLLIGCPDRPGIVAAVSGFLREQGANIVSSHQYSTDPTGGRFFMRTELVLPALDAGDDPGPGAGFGAGVGDGAHAGGRGDGGGGTSGGGDAGVEAEARDGDGERKTNGEGENAMAARGRFEELFAVEVARELGMDWEIRYRGQRRRIAILVSRHDHCLVDLLWRWRCGELDGEVVKVLSNHEDLRREVESAGVAFHHVPVHPAEKPRAEAVMLDLLEGEVELVVLARYMQILSAEFLARVGVPAINIHHSFLPAFAGAGPYARARARGVKLIGATAHYVTEQLDDGPIIEQDVVRVGHEQTVEDLERVGRDIERLVLARAVALHLDDRVIVDGRRTVVF
jgi:formyltetrahydrofolate deformylase